METKIIIDVVKMLESHPPDTVIDMIKRIIELDKSVMMIPCTEEEFNDTLAKALTESKQRIGM